MEARGNVDTRLRRLREGKWDAIVLARAGLARLGRLEEIVEIFPEEVLLPAVGQGALAIVARGDDARMADILSAIDDAASHAEVVCERAILAALEAGCRAPVAARARVRGCFADGRGGGLLRRRCARPARTLRRRLRGRRCGSAGSSGPGCSPRGAAALIGEAGD